MDIYRDVAGRMLSNIDLACGVLKNFPVIKMMSAPQQIDLYMGFVSDPWKLLHAYDANGNVRSLHVFFLVVPNSLLLRRSPARSRTHSSQ